jgi:hypothetical protein
MEREMFDSPFELGRPAWDEHFSMLVLRFCRTQVMSASVQVEVASFEMKTIKSTRAELIWFKCLLLPLLVCACKLSLIQRISIESDWLFVQTK